MNNNVDYYSDVKSVADQTPTIDEVIDVIRNGDIKDVIDQVREIKRTGTPQEYRAAKRALLPAVTWSGTFDGRHNKKTLKQYNNLICVDIDHCDVEAVKAKLKDDPYVVTAFMSPGGDGVKVIIQFAPHEKVSEWNLGLNNENRDEALRNIDRYHVAQFKDLQRYFLEKYNITIDDVCSDYSRLCFLSYDIDTYIAPTALPRPIVEIVDKNTPPITAATTPIVENDKEDDDEEPEDTTKWTLGQVEWKLHLIPADDYGVWRNVGWALKDAYNTTEAFNIFVEWSKKSTKFESADECKELIWNTTKDITTPVTLNTIAMYYWKEADKYYKNVYDDIERKSEIYDNFISMTSTQYLIQKRDGYKMGGRNDVVREIKDYLMSKYITPRKKIVDYIINNLFLVKEKYPRISVLKKGIHNLGGEYYLVENSSEIITPMEGEWTNIKNLMETLPAKDREWLYSRLQLDLHGYMKRNMCSRGQAVMFIGQAQCGKTTIAVLIKKLQGGYAAPAAGYVMSKGFNKEMLMYPIWLIDDNLNRATGVGCREFHEKFKELIKMATIQDSPAFEAKYKDAVVVDNIYRRLIITLNNSQEILELLPDNTDDILDKYSILQCNKSFITGAFDEQLLWNELPAFAYFLLNTWTKPTWIEENTRLGIVQYHNAEITKQIFEASQVSSLFDDIKLIMTTEVKGEWNANEKKYDTMEVIESITDTASNLYNHFSQLVADKRLRPQVKTFNIMKASQMGAQLRELEKQLPKYVAKTGYKAGIQLWKIDLKGEIFYGTE